MLSGLYIKHFRCRRYEHCTDCTPSNDQTKHINDMVDKLVARVVKFKEMRFSIISTDNLFQPYL